MEEPHEALYDEACPPERWLNGLARECPKCHIVDHYEVNGRRPKEVECKCGAKFVVQKYKRGERPKPKRASD